MVKNLSTQETWVQSLGQEIPWNRKWHPTPVFLLGKFHRQRSLVGYSPWGHKEADTTEQLTHCLIVCSSFPDITNVKESACNAGDPRSIPGLGRSSGEVNGNALQYSCLENPMDRGTYWATVHRVAKSLTQMK